MHNYRTLKGRVAIRTAGIATSAVTVAALLPLLSCAGPVDITKLNLTMYCLPDRQSEVKQFDKQNAWGSGSLRNPTTIVAGKTLIVLLPALWCAQVPVECQWIAVGKLLKHDDCWFTAWPREARWDNL